MQNRLELVYDLNAKRSRGFESRSPASVSIGGIVVVSDIDYSDCTLDSAPVSCCQAARICGKLGILQDVTAFRLKKLKITIVACS
jgi:hypothetical protein